MAKAAGSPFGVVQHFHRLPDDLAVSRDHHLANTLPVIDGKRFGREVYQDYPVGISFRSRGFKTTGSARFARMSIPADSGVAYPGSGWCDLFMIFTSINSFISGQIYINIPDYHLLEVPLFFKLY